MEPLHFTDRAQAGRLLGKVLAGLRLDHPLVLALPRGGVPVAAEVARALQAPLDLLMVRKIGAPGQPEYAVAAIAEGPDATFVVEDQALAATGVDLCYGQREAARQAREIERRRAIYLAGRRRLLLAGRPVVVVDDGVATGATVRAALAAVRRQQASRLVLAVPVAPADTLARLRREVDDLVCLTTPEFFRAVGLHYDDFHQVSDDEVVALLASAGSGGSDA